MSTVEKKNLNVKINGKEATVPEGTVVLEVCKKMMWRFQISVTTESSNPLLPAEHAWLKQLSMAKKNSFIPAHILWQKEWKSKRLQKKRIDIIKHV